jgi:hypothetical protein
MPLIAAATISHCHITGVSVITEKGLSDIGPGKCDSAHSSSALYPTSSRSCGSSLGF